MTNSKPTINSKEMKTVFVSIFSSFLVTAFVLTGCNSGTTPAEGETTASVEAADGGQATVVDDVSQKDIVKVASGSPEHTTLVKAIVAADLVNVLANAGPFTVFAPTNAAFDALPEGALADLLKPEKLADLQNILQYHVAVAVYKPEMLKDGQVINMANGDNITLSVKEGKIMVNGTGNVVASVPATNGIIHIVDAVLLPPPPAK
jgi:uncharacterized surface protein with fasciclin (FAS1) repeats